MDNNYFKYLKYKKKYLELKKMHGGINKKPINNLSEEEKNKIIQLNKEEYEKLKKYIGDIKAFEYIYYEYYIYLNKLINKNFSINEAVEYIDLIVNNKNIDIDKIINSMIKIKKNGFKSKSAYDFSTSVILTDKKITKMTELKNKYNKKNNYNESLFYDIITIFDDNLIEKLEKLCDENKINIQQAYSAILSLKNNNFTEEKIKNMILLKNANIDENLLYEIAKNLKDNQINLLIIKKLEPGQLLDDSTLYQRIKLNIIR